MDQNEDEIIYLMILSLIDEFILLRFGLCLVMCSDSKINRSRCWLVRAMTRIWSMEIGWFASRLWFRGGLWDGDDTGFPVLGEMPRCSLKRTHAKRVLQPT